MGTALPRRRREPRPGGCGAITSRTRIKKVDMASPGRVRGYPAPTRCGSSAIGLARAGAGLSLRAPSSPAARSASPGGAGLSDAAGGRVLVAGSSGRVQGYRRPPVRDDGPGRLVRAGTGLSRRRETAVVWSVAPKRKTGHFNGSASLGRYGAGLAGRGGPAKEWRRDQAPRVNRRFPLCRREWAWRTRRSSQTCRRNSW